ncbi:50S ribosomal protein L31 [Candidatus Berkelbacteria bacterium]|nr:50S ribosomal protein L31 [Candidatus Berkelbacteria bacterium]
MKANIHPTYFATTEISCACGEVYRVGSTVASNHVEICAACHPFFSGKGKLIDTARRIDSFKKRQAMAKHAS